MKLNTLNDVFLHAAGRGKTTIAHWQSADNTWHPLSSEEFGNRVQRVAAWLQQFGVKKGDRVALISENRWEWAVVDFAAMALGAVGVPLFPTLTADVTAAQLADSGSKICVVSTADLARKVLQKREQTALEALIIMASQEQIEGTFSFDEILQTEPRDDFRQTLESISPSDIATIIYTSGTTGDAKGVVLTHGNMASNLEQTTALFDFTNNDHYISFLPLSHVTARHIDYLIYAMGVQVAYCGRVEKLLPAFQQIRPTIFVAVPRLYERIRHSVEQKSAASPIKKKILSWAIREGRKHQAAILAGRTPASLSWKLANKLVYSKVKQAFGGRVEVFVSGGAPLGIDLANWFADAAIPVLEGYGLTETSPVISVNMPGAHKVGSTGKTLKNLSCVIADDGELLVKGPSVFTQYWKKPEATQEVFDASGYFHTGDVGVIDPDGFLFITDRKKELVKTSNGKFIAPQPIENKLKVSSLIGHAALQGDKRKFVSVLFSPNFQALEEKAKDLGITTTDRQQLVDNPRVLDLYQAEIDRVNADLAPFEKIKRFQLLPVEWSIESGELTPSMKLKRRVVAQKHAHEIAEMYGSET